MPVFLSTATLGNADSLWTLGHSGELMAAFYPRKDDPQNIHECVPALYIYEQNRLIWLWSDEFSRHQKYLPQTNILETKLSHAHLQLEITITDVVPPGETVLARRIEIENHSAHAQRVGFFLYGDWNLGGQRMGNALRFDRAAHALVQNHREAAVSLAGSAVEMWSAGKAGMDWGSNAKRDLEDGFLHCNDLEIGDVCWSVGFQSEIAPQESISKELILALATTDVAAVALASKSAAQFDDFAAQAREHDLKYLQPGLDALKSRAGGENLPEDLRVAYERSLLCLPLLCGREGAAVAAPEFDFEFISCGGYGYFWPRDGGEYASGLLDAGYPEFCELMLDWCARHQDEAGLWHQRYFLNGAVGPNWCLPPEHLQIDQVGAVGWILGKYMAHLKANKQKLAPKKKAIYAEMMRKSGDYLLSRLTERGVHGNAFDTWETLVGSFVYSNASIRSSLLISAQLCGDDKYLEGANAMASSSWCAAWIRLATTTTRLTRPRWAPSSLSSCSTSTIRTSWSWRWALWKSPSARWKCRG
jgi:GH15 family glucan-1,4-alpha-glucosidase